MVRTGTTRGRSRGSCGLVDPADRFSWEGLNCRRLVDSRGISPIEHGGMQPLCMLSGRMTQIRAFNEPEADLVRAGAAFALAPGTNHVA